jgi:predicted aminopeptidase
MDFLKITPILFLLAGCTMPRYLFKQSIGQLKIQTSGEPNEKVLADPRISQEHKDKIKIIVEAKKFFLHYFEHKNSGIYSKTIFLDEPAVSWLVIASKHDEIKAHEHSFPFMGSFPYIGFFSKKDAESFEQGLRQEKLVTYIRPVYAYSTLGYFEDRILSSFFEYDEVELVELVFHELFHTLFFVKDNVEFNENLASFIADRLLEEYFKENPKLALYRKQQEAHRRFDQQLVSIAKGVESEFANKRPSLSASEAKKIVNTVVVELLIPVVRDFCAQQKFTGEDCADKPEEWNQARLAALLTYQSSQNFLDKLIKDMDAKLFYAQLKVWQKEWSKDEKGKSFMEFLETKI